MTGLISMMLAGSMGLPIYRHEERYETAMPRNNEARQAAAKLKRIRKATYQLDTCQKCKDQKEYENVCRKCKQAWDLLNIKES